MKNMSQRRNRAFASNLIHNTLEEAIEQYKECEAVISKLTSINKPYLQHASKNGKISIDKVPVWLLKNYS
ncbi:MAG: hypothetical protein HOD92_04395 [Deltaproteobacteria bacterium]|jgi:hypothetical protein|nr:hypothetical protein [Deltaproteobacteria bacterium]MBT4526952.1 hypothetical protein [Deltaproteobacteria bacterium]